MCKGLQPSRGGSGATEICCGAMCRARYLGKHFPTGLLNDIAENKNLVASFGTFPAVVQFPEIPRPKARSSSLTSLGSLRREDCPERILTALGARVKLEIGRAHV